MAPRSRSRSPIRPDPLAWSVIALLAMGGQGSAHAAYTDLLATADARGSAEGALGAGVSPVSLPEPDAGPRLSAPSTDLYLEVWHGDRALGKIGHFRLRDGRLWCAPEE